MSPTKVPAKAKEPLPIGWRLAAGFLIAYLLVPLIVVLFVTGVDGDSFVCRVRVESRLGATENGKLEFLLVDTDSARSPAAKFVATLDHGYTRGMTGITAPGSGRGPETTVFPQTPTGTIFTLEGALMDKATYSGDQYLFFDDYPEVYVKQVRTTYFWPSQISGVESLYLSPFKSVTSVYLVFASPFAEGYSLGSWLLTLGRFLLLCVAVAAVLVWRKTRGGWMPGTVWVAGVYMLLAIFLAAPDL